jgi:hypothetical protein
MLDGKRTSGAVGPLVFITVLILLPSYSIVPWKGTQGRGTGRGEHARLSSYCAYHSALPAEITVVSMQRSVHSPDSSHTWDFAWTGLVSGLYA